MLVHPPETFRSRVNQVRTHQSLSPTSRVPFRYYHSTLKHCSPASQSPKWNYFLPRLLLFLFASCVRRPVTFSLYRLVLRRPLLTRIAREGRSIRPLSEPPRRKGVRTDRIHLCVRYSFQRWFDELGQSGQENPLDCGLRTEARTHDGRNDTREHRWHAERILAVGTNGKREERTFRDKTFPSFFSSSFMLEIRFFF